MFYRNRLIFFYIRVLHYFEKLYEAMHLIVGEDGESPAYDSVRIRVIGVYYDTRRSMMVD